MAIVVVMGVSGSGKTTVGRAIAGRAGLPFADADDFHPPANLAKMAGGRPLTDEDRRPWLLAVAGWIREHGAGGGVVACSALKRGYRDVLRATGQCAWFLHLSGERAVIAARTRSRTGHFMPPELLASQYAVLEPLQPDEPGLTVDVGLSPETIVESALRVLRGQPTG